MTDLGITMEDLSDSRLMIQGFNLNSECAIGIIRLDLVNGELTSSTLFHVIDTHTSYKMLLGRPRLHENGGSRINPPSMFEISSWRRELKINGDVKPFSTVDSYFVDAKFFEDDEPSSEMFPSRIPSTGKWGTNKNGDIPSSSSSSESATSEMQQQKCKAKVKEEVVDQPMKAIKKTITTPVLRYIPKSYRKEGKSSIAGCQVMKVEIKKEKRVDETTLQSLNQ